MAEQNSVLRDHPLAHLSKLSVGEDFFRARFPKACSTSRCNANCCKNGVWTDLKERDTILRNADLIRNHMDPDQEQNSNRWFDAEIREDTDYPSGQSVSTQVYGGACVFLNNARRCVLQKASQNHCLNLKPFFCLAFPITIEKGQLKIDNGFNLDCCTLAPDGVLDVFDVCAPELTHVLGEAGVRELEQLATSGWTHRSDSKPV
jgi:Fe-S-cluster containining protein